MPAMSDVVVAGKISRCDVIGRDEDDVFIPYIRPYNYRLRSREDNTFGSVRVCVSVRLSVGTLQFEPFDLDFWHDDRP